MSDYTICPRVIELAGKNKSYLLDILMPFVPNNSNKICLDKKDILLEEYKRKINGNKDLSDWYKWLTYRENFSIIDLEKSYSNLDELLVNIAKASFDKELVV